MTVEKTTLAGIKTTRIGYGCSRLHYLRSSSQRQKLLEAAYEVGIRHFDTAPVYGHGLAEREVAAFAKRHPDCIVVSKFGIPATTWIGALSDPFYSPAMAARTLYGRLNKKQAPQEITPLSLRRAVDESLARMKRDVIDIHLLHEPHPDFVDLEGVFSAYERLIEEGKLRAAGVSGDFETAKEMLAYAPERFLLQTDESQWDRSRIPEITYGAISRQPQSRSQNAVSREVASERITSALARRPNGVVLISTTHPENIYSLTA